MLETIAKESGGKSYAASSAEALSQIYKEIDTLEPSPIRSENYLNQKLLLFFPLALIFLLLFLWVIYQKRSES
jgi:Ca-activated chloride channel family protein